MEHRASLVRVSVLSLTGIVSALAIKLMIAFAPMIATFTLIGAAIAGVALVIDDLWVAFKGGDSIFLNLHKRARAFFGPIEQWLLSLPKAFLDWVTSGISKALDFIQEKFTAFTNWIAGMAEALKERLAGLFDGIMPDFIKQGISATLKTVGGFSDQSEPRRLNERLAPTPASTSHQNRISSNQNVNVAVNVKSGADPHEIAGEVSKAVRSELERERFNAFMGVTQYASN